MFTTIIKRQKGFLLVETSVAITIIAIAFLVLVGLFIQLTQTTNISAQYTVAANLAQKQIELLKNQPVTFWNELNLSEPQSINWQDNTLNPNNMRPSFIVTTTARQCAEINAANLVTVIVTIQWVEFGRNQTVSFTTFFSKI